MKALRQRKKGFSLLELIVAIAIIAIILALVGFGISIAQRNSRDSQRRQAANDVKLALEDYFGRNRSYPGNFGSGGEVVSLSTNQIVIGSDDLVVPLEGATEWCGPGTGLGTDAQSTANCTVYCYNSNPSDGYTLGVELENGSPNWENFGTSLLQECAGGGTGGESGTAVNR